ncbi:MAG: glutamate-5-semialdehyde dehydrogenase [Planctomyces sp.]|nr:glutamate-5-semialdehyde dehydrogenase [Planctomyces sp.]
MTGLVHAEGVVVAAQQARLAARQVAALPTGVKNAVLGTLAGLIESERDAIVAATEADVAAARSDGYPEAKVRRLALSVAAVGQMAEGVRQVASLPDPVGAVVSSARVPSGLEVRRERTPIGVVCMIYEARPGVTVDAFALCFKAGNACVLKGGKEAARANALLGGLVRRALDAHGCPAHAAVILPALSRQDLLTLLGRSESIDLVIPRGGHEMIRFITEHTRIPTLAHAHGVCHIYVDQRADLDAAVPICLTAKASAPSACNAVECVLVHRAAAERFLPALAEGCRAAGVQLRADAAALPLCAGAVAASPEDFGREFLDLILAVAVVDDLDAAVGHIHTHGSGHTDAILTRDAAAAERFTSLVRSSCVLVNASTRFNDGFQLGLGAEIGISTSRLHAYGPMGLEELTVSRFVVHGRGQTR